jgi:hypothetical protein
MIALRAAPLIRGALDGCPGTILMKNAAPAARRIATAGSLQACLERAGLYSSPDQ